MMPQQPPQLGPQGAGWAPGPGPRPLGPPGMAPPFRPSGPGAGPLGPPSQLNKQMGDMSLGGPVKPLGPPGQGPLGPPRPMGPPGQGPPRPMGPPGVMRPPAPGPAQPQVNGMNGHSSGPGRVSPAYPSTPSGVAPSFPPGPRPGLPPAPTSQPSLGPPASMGGPSPAPNMGPPSTMGGQAPNMMPPSSMGGPAPNMGPPASMGGPALSNGPPAPTGVPTPSFPPQPGMGGMGGPAPSFPPQSQGGMMPPLSGARPPAPGMMPPSSMGGAPPHSMGPPQPGPPQPGPMQGPPRPGLPPTPGMMPPPNSLGGMPPMMPPGPNMAPSASGGPGMPPTPGMMPPGPGMMPPNPGMMPPTSGMMPPTSGMMPPTPGMMPPASGGMGMPPQPGGQYPPGPGQGGQYPGAMPQQRKQLDPDSMPNPIQVMADDRANHSTGEFVTSEKGKVPPLVTTQFITRDQGNAGPRLMRSTMYSVPDSPDMKKQTGVPLGLVLSPLAQPALGEYPVPVVNLGEGVGPVRCMRCKAYMCPMMVFTEGGKRFQCPFCKASTEVPQEYFQHLDHTGQRMDKYERPELCLGTFEMVATKDYCRDSVLPNPPGILFAIDVSYPMMKEGVVQLLCQSMKDILSSLPIDEAAGMNKSVMKVGFMTYDKKINFYNCNSALAQPQMMTVGDVEDMFVPLAKGLMVDVEQSEAVIDSLMETIPKLFVETRETETILGPVIQAGKEAFKAANMSGKLVVFHHNLPVAEAPGKLKNRDDRKCLGTDKEKSVLTPQTKFYNDLGQECVGVGCSVDLFLFNNAYVDIATLSQVSRLTGGQVYKYTYFQPDLDGERFISDLRHNVARPVAFDAIMRVRTSTGVRPTDFFGSFFMANTTDMELASINSDVSLTCEIKHDDKLTDEDGVYIQAALLYTSCGGQRRLRITNLSLNVCDNMGELYRNCDLDTIINFLAKQNISKLMETSPKAVKEGLMQQCATILACYRKNCASPSSAGQLILPECMKLLPLYTNCLIKSDALSGGPDLGCDDRAFHMVSVGSMDVGSTVAYFYPRLIPIHDASVEEAGIPGQIRATMDKVKDDGVYLLENGIHCLLYVGLATDPAWIRDVFGVSTAAQIDIDKTKLLPRDNITSRRVIDIYNAVIASRPRTMKLTIVRQRDKLEIVFKHFLCEDRSSASESHFSYVDFLCHMHKEIRAMLN